ncbi:LysR family transcriptional regulator [Paraburkholderia solisilvae]|uniref:HTH-type transcriptional regulator HdfR n=1 Tax=Paraburkholderia solisilvae TaxID=624376 RepID=A0A6J5E4E8_9BURK|nr:LysR family transcriptional regulator [Paraburkholderia solisilvae]CAB3761349.1 HTH-type transcriptional regulator HdfR [Paraburkholderia solisilvae]
MDLNALQTFIAVVRAGGFAAAARETDVPRSSVSSTIRKLEKNLGVRLFKRSTRAFSLTAEGQTLYQNCANAMSSLTDAVASVTGGGESFGGEIRMTLPADFPAHIAAAAIAEYRQRHPAVRFHIRNTNEVLDLVANNIDLALRIGSSNPQDAIIRGVINMNLGLFGSKRYVETTGVPLHIREVASLIGPQRAELRRLILESFASDARPAAFDIVADSFTFIRELVLCNQGVGILPISLCRADMEAGSMVRVLDEQFSLTVRMCLTHPSRADLSPKVASFAQVLARHLEAGSNSLAPAAIG